MQPPGSGTCRALPVLILTDGPPDGGHLNKSRGSALLLDGPEALLLGQRGSLALAELPVYQQTRGATGQVSQSRAREKPAEYWG